jgi:hypothetical protein
MIECVLNGKRLTALNRNVLLHRIDVRLGTGIAVRFRCPMRDVRL